MPWLACSLHGVYLPVLFASLVYSARSWLLIPPIPIPAPAPLLALPRFGAPASSIAIFRCYRRIAPSCLSINA